MDLPRPAGEKSKATPFVTHERMGENIGVQRKVLARVIGVEKNSDVNAKKITQITKILKLRKENVDKKLKGEGVDNKVLAERLNGIASALKGLGAAQQKSNNENKRFRLRFWRRDREEGIEKEKKKKEEKKSSGGGGVGGVLGAIKAPFTGIFDTAKTFFGNIVAGSAVLGLMEWLKGLDASQWEGLIKTLQDNAKLILGGILAVAALPVLAAVGTFVLALIGAVAVFGPIIAVIGKALAWMAAAAGAIAAIMAVAKGVKWVGNKIRDKFTGGAAFSQKHSELDQRLIDAGMDKRGMITNRRRKVGVRSEEQEKIFQEVKAERKRLWDLKKKQDEDVKALNKKLNASGISNTGMVNISKGSRYRGGSVEKHGTTEQKELWAEVQLKKAEVLNKYSNLAASKGAQISIPSSSPANIGETKVTSRNIDQPLGGEGSVNFLPLGDTSSEGGASSGSGGGSNVPSFSAESGNIGNRFILGAVN